MQVHYYWAVRICHEKQSLHSLPVLQKMRPLHRELVSPQKTQTPFYAMKKSDSQKLDQIITMLGEVVDVFGKRFDKIEREMATKGQVIAVHTQVNSIETQLRGMKYTKLQLRVADLEDEVFGEARA
jgi:hypothetical protein